MIPALINHLWQSTLFALGAGLLTLVLRKNGAGVRYGLWFAASVKFLIPFALLAAAGGLAVQKLHLSLSPPPGLAAIAQAVEPFAPAARAVSSPALLSTAPHAVLAIVPHATLPGRGAALDPAPILLGAWALGLAMVLMVWAGRWSRIRAALRAATPAVLSAPVPVLSTPVPIEPGVVGLLRPVVIVPEGIVEQLSPAELDAVLAHEICHIRRRDNLTGAVHMLVQALFWFHPLVWWMGARLVAERELACDEAVVRSGADARTYAKGILKVCRLYLQQRLVCVAGASGADLKRRVERILADRIGVRLSAPKRVLLAGAGALSIIVPVSAGLIAWAPMTALAEAAIAKVDPPKPAPQAPAPEAVKAIETAPVAAAKTPAEPQAAKPIMLAAVEAALAPTPEVEGGAERAQLVTDLWPASPDLAVVAVAEPQIAYSPPGAPQRVFGGEFGLTEPGPVAWRHACYTWHVRSQKRRTGPFASAAMDGAFKRFISGLVTETPNYEDMTPTMAQAVRRNLVTYWPSLNHMGHASVARKFDTTKDGEDLYVLDLAGGVTHWNVIVDPQGKIAAAFLCVGPGL